MNLIFKKVKLVNFGSYLDAEINLDNKGFCLISGENNYKKDNAESNGSGKSTIFSAICFALTGETLSGVSKNLKNIYTAEPDCSVMLDLTVDGDEFSIVRTHKPKSDLKIYRNGVDESGKGITESTKRLEELLPEVNKDLLASTILLGQGNVNKFSAFSPSGRKQLLETLTKSDYQIEDIKNRIADRRAVLTAKSTALNNALIACKTSISTYTNSLEKKQAELNNAKKPDFEAELQKIDQTISGIQKNITSLTTQITEAEEAYDLNNKALLAVSSAKAESYQKLNESYEASTSDLKIAQVNLNNEIGNLTKEINSIKNIKDTCPTCGQKLVGVVKKDTTELEAKVAELKINLTKLTEELANKAKRKTEFTKQIEDGYSQQLQAAQAAATNSKQAITKFRQEQTGLQNQLLAETNKRTQCVYNQQHWDNYYEGLKKEIEGYQQNIAEQTRLYKLNDLGMTEVSSRLTIVNKIDTLTKRDFRGYLLEDIIKYIDNKSKHYCSIVFNTTDLSIALDGNNLNISYCDKSFDNLSGGEKQRCDIILQFAIRDLLQKYLNYTSNIIVLDEIFDALDAKATAKVLELINTELKDIDSVFIISHHATELGLNYDEEIRIIKNSDGISEVVKK